MNETVQLILRTAGVIVLALALPVVLIAWLKILKYSFKVIAAVKPGVNRWGAETMFNPFNVLIRPSLLTEEGLRYRREVGKNVLWFLGPLLLVFVLAWAGGLLE